MSLRIFVNPGCIINNLPKFIYRSIFGFVKKFMDENSITVPSKCTKVITNNIWPERGTSDH